MRGAGRPEQAIGMLSEVLEKIQRLFPPEHQRVMHARQNIANTLLAIGDYAGAKAAYEEQIPAAQFAEADIP